MTTDNQANQNSIAEWNKHLSSLTLRERITFAFNHFDEHIGIAFSGAEDVILIDVACKITKKPHIFTLETGRLHPQTLKFIEKVREHYDINIKLLYPEKKDLEKFVEKKGLYSFYHDGHSECCSVRKVQPLSEHLQKLSAWINGQRKDQSPSTRDTLSYVEIDTRFKGQDTDLIKFNPLADWSSKQVWEYIRSFDVPYNKLHEQGFVSIGCEPCTRPINPSQHEREGRWWWEEETLKECGLHTNDATAEKTNQ